MLTAIYTCRALTIFSQSDHLRVPVRSKQTLIEMVGYRVVARVICTVLLCMMHQQVAALQQAPHHHRLLLLEEHEQRQGDMIQSPRWS